MTEAGLHTLELLRFYCFSSQDHRQFRSLLQYYINLRGANNLILRYGLNLDLIVELVRAFCDMFCRRFPSFVSSVSDDKLALNRFRQVMDILNRPLQLATPHAPPPPQNQRAMAPSPAATAGYRPPPLYPNHGNSSRSSLESGTSATGGRLRGPQTPPVASGRHSADLVNPVKRELRLPVEASMFQFEFMDQNLVALHNHPLNNCKVCTAYSFLVNLPNIQYFEFVFDGLR